MTLQEAIIGRISHDLAGGVGALINTIDLINIDDSFTKEGLDLIHTTSQTLTARLKFFRSVYGANNKTINTELAQDYVNTLASHIQINGSVTTRLQLAIILVATEILALGGIIDVSDNNIILSGQELHQNPVVVQVLMGKDVEVSAENASAIWLAHLLKEENKHLTFNARESNLILTLV